MKLMKPCEAWAVVTKDGEFVSAANNPEVLAVWPEADFLRVRVQISEIEQLLPAPPESEGK